MNADERAGIDRCLAQLDTLKAQVQRMSDALGEPDDQASHFAYMVYVGQLQILDIAILQLRAMATQGDT
jgi:hypothetical protein